MSDALKRAAHMALDAIQRGETFQYLDDVVAPSLRAALATQPHLVHNDSCWSWGPQHYLCCYNEVGRLRALLQKHET